MDYGTNSTTTPTTTESVYVYVTYRINGSTASVTSDPWLNLPTATYAAVNYEPVAKQELDWPAINWEARRAASMVPPPRENRAHARRHLKVRKGFQQLARIPCYRGVRTR